MENVVFDVSSPWQKPILLEKGSESADVELITRILAGDPGAQETFVTRFGRVIVAVLRRLRLSQEEREDLYQQAFVHLWENDYRRLRQWQGSKGKFSSFLGVVVIRLAYRTLRAHRPDPSWCQTVAWSGLLPQPECDTLVFEKQRQAAITSTLGSLRPRDAALITRRHYYGKSYREMSDELGITVNHVGVALSRAEERLRKRLCQDYPDLFDLQ